MSKTQPIKEMEQINELKNYFLEKGEIRNYTLIVIGLNTSLRISDILRLQWKDIYNFRTGTYRQHINLIEQKTGKNNIVAINEAVVEACEKYRKILDETKPDLYVFKSRTGYNRPISRNRAFNIIREASKEIGFENNISCHSLRKTFGYQAWKKGVPPALLMSIYNHSSYEITKRYLGINQDERDSVFMGLKL